MYSSAQVHRLARHEARLAHASRSYLWRAPLRKRAQMSRIRPAQRARSGPRTIAHIDAVLHSGRCHTESPQVHISSHRAHSARRTRTTPDPRLTAGRSCIIVLDEGNSSTDEGLPAEHRLWTGCGLRRRARSWSGGLRSRNGRRDKGMRGAYLCG
ncbi:hypothetical protein OBBRIDRAFT_251747 [Obba rivulosa]|uniref:Uncharacterized protein n=1 Tax=Obba rivulosa TaxID=1052685 RepID=A0A8E2J3C7_9APHY|nr:hypothetical protein OBBRIDRAFT_251747 [Obba rivulosa]